MADDIEKDYIGVVQRGTHGWNAKCSRCEWRLDARAGQEGAERSLKAHAEIIHPLAIKVYR